MYAPKFDEVVNPYLHYPTVIQHALIRVETHPTFRALTKSTLLVLKYIVSRASSLNGEAIIRARVDRLAEEAAVCCKTVQRALKILDQCAWVARVGPERARSEWGVYESERYRLSPELCRLLELPSGNISAQRTGMSDGPIYDLNYKKELQEISIKNRGAKPITLPDELTDMPAETGIQPSGVCKLMGIASKAGHQLAHVYTVAKQYLVNKGLKGARAFCYLQTMLANPKPTDYAARAGQINRLTRPESVTEDPLVLIARECRHKRYRHVSKPGVVVQFFDGVCVVHSGQQQETFAGPQLQGFYRGIANGNLCEIKS